MLDRSRTSTQQKQKQKTRWGKRSKDGQKHRPEGSEEGNQSKPAPEEFGSRQPQATHPVQQEEVSASQCQESDKSQVTSVASQPMETDDGEEQSIKSAAQKEEAEARMPTPSPAKPPVDANKV